MRTLSPRVAIQGERGSFTEEAAVSYFGATADFEVYRTLEEALSSVESGLADYSVVPIENSLAGSVGEAYDLLLKHDLLTVGEVKIRVEHNLLGVKGSAIDGIRVIWSHPQALEQCRRFLGSMDVQLVPKPNTATAARELSEVHDPSIGVIASRRAAELYGLRVLASNIEDEENNYTRFFVMGREARGRTGHDKTSLIFSTKHEPGSLYNALKAFAVRGINLTKIESRPMRSKPWEYYFFLDCEGHVDDDVCADALMDLSRNTTSLKVLGSYPRADG